MAHARGTLMMMKTVNMASHICSILNRDKSACSPRKLFEFLIDSVYLINPDPEVKKYYSQPPLTHIPSTPSPKSYHLHQAPSTHAQRPRESLGLRYTIDLFLRDARYLGVHFFKDEKRHQVFNFQIAVRVPPLVKRELVA